MSDHNEDSTNDNNEAKHGDGDIYKLTPNKLSRHRSSLERRAYKDLLGDRRSKVRLTASGEPQPDRRVANRIANERLKKKTG